MVRSYRGFQYRGRGVRVLDSEWVTVVFHSLLELGESNTGTVSVLVADVRVHVSVRGGRCDWV